MKRLLILGLGLAGCGTAPREPLPDSLRYGPPPSAAARPVEAPVSSMTLERALEIAERIHPELATARAKAEAAEGRALQAGLLPNPSLIGRVEAAPFEGDTAGQAEVLVGVSQRLPVGGRLGAAREAESMERLRLEKEADVRRLEIRGRVHGAFATALYGAEVVRLKEAAVDFVRRGVAVARVRRDVGDATADEVARAELEEIRARLERDKAAGLRDLAYAGLAAALGDPGLRFDSVEGALETTFELPTLEAVLEALREGAHEALAGSEVEAARARLEQAKAERVPDVTLDLFYRRIEHGDTDAFDAGLSVPLPLFDRNQGRIREAEAERRAAEARGRSTRGEAVRRVREAHLRLTEALTHARRVREELLPKVETVLRVAETRYGAGDLSLSDVLPIRRDAAQARMAYLDALREVMEGWGELRSFLR